MLADGLRRGMHQRAFEIAEAMDAAAYDTLESLLEHAALVDGSSGSVLAEGGRSSGRPFPFDRQGPPRWHLANKHVTTNPVVAVNDDEATIRSMYTVFQQTETLPMQAIIAGRYHDTLRRIDGTWRLVERRYFADLIGNLSDHLTFDL